MDSDGALPNQSDLFQNLYASQFKLIWINSKKLFNLVWCKSVENLSELIRWSLINMS